MSTLVIASGYFNPLGQQHLNYLNNAKKLGDILVVIVNSDEQVKLKGSVPFQDHYERCAIIESLKFVDIAIPSIDEDATVDMTIEYVVNDIGKNFDKIIFANGGDATPNQEERNICEKYGIEMMFGVGGDKVGSSSKTIEKAFVELVQMKGWVVIE